MSESTYVLNTICSITLLILSNYAASKYLYNEESEENDKVIRVDMSDLKRSIPFLIIVFIILFTPIVNWAIAIVHGSMVAYKGYKLSRNKKK
jgi:uncharacterized membrane protein